NDETVKYLRQTIGRDSPLFLRPGDVLVQRSNTADLVGTAAVFDGPVDTFVYPDLMMRLRFYRRPAAEWFWRYANSSNGRRFFRGAAAGSTGSMPKISGAVLRDMPIPWASDHEQEAVAEALGDADALIESLEHLLAKKRKLKQGAMQELLTGKKRLPGFDQEWKWRSLGELFDFSGGVSASREQLSSNGHCYLHYGDIHMSAKTYVDVMVEADAIPKLDIPLAMAPRTSLLADGDVVFVDASEDDEGTSKHVVIVNKERVPFISGLHTIVAKSKTEDLDHLYRRYCFQTTVVKRQFRFFAVGTKVSGVSKSNIARISMSVPS